MIVVVRSVESKVAAGQVAFVRANVILEDGLVMSGNFEGVDSDEVFDLGSFSIVIMANGNIPLDACPPVGVLS